MAQNHIQVWCFQMWSCGKPWIEHAQRNVLIVTWRCAWTEHWYSSGYYFQTAEHIRTWMFYYSRHATSGCNCNMFEALLSTLLEQGSMCSGHFTHISTLPEEQEADAQLLNIVRPLRETFKNSKTWKQILMNTEEGGVWYLYSTAMYDFVSDTSQDTHHCFSP